MHLTVLALSSFRVPDTLSFIFPSSLSYLLYLLLSHHLYPDDLFSSPSFYPYPLSVYTSLFISKSLLTHSFIRQIFREQRPCARHPISPSFLLFPHLSPRLLLPPHLSPLFASPSLPISTPLSPTPYLTIFPLPFLSG